MVKNFVIASLGAIALATSVPTLAADLSLKVDSAGKNVAVTNNMAANTTLLYLKSPDDMNLPVYAQLAQGATVNVPLRFAMPAGVTTAMAEFNGQRQFVTVEVK